jgi:hypothetical protein
MESEKIHNCGFCDNPNVSKKCGKSHTRCKETRFCNKTCETAAHSKERKSEVTANENPVDESLKNAIESEIKRKAKRERQTRLNIIRAMNRGGSGRIQNLPTFPGAMVIVVPQSPEDGTQDQN